MNTRVMVEFVITGDQLNPIVATEKLALLPKKYWLKGDEIQGRRNKRIDTCWIIGTEYEESLDINDQLSKVLANLHNKQPVLSSLKLDFHVDYTFVIVVNIENNVKPAMHFDEKFISFSNDIGAELDIDLYIF